MVRMIKVSHFIQCLLSRYLDISLFLVLAGLFHFFPQIDIWISGHFYDQSRHWYMNENAWIIGVYESIKFVTWVLFLALLVFMIWAYRKSPYVKTRKTSLFLFLALLFGPGIAVNNVFKEYFERPRPREVQEFSGSEKHIAAFSLDRSCDDCKSFVSGHAAIGFFVMVLAWPLRQRRWLYLGLVSGCVVGGMRVMQGGHFFSDVLFSGFVCYFVYRLLSRITLGYSKIR